MGLNKFIILKSVKSWRLDEKVGFSVAKRIGLREHCLMEMPEIAELYRTANDFEVVAINDVDTPEEIRKFVQKPNYRFPVAIDEGAKTAEAYRVKDEGHPISYLIKPDRTVGYVQVGYDTEKKLAKLEAELAKLGIRRQTMRK